MVPYADFNLLKFPDKAQAMEKIRDLTCLSDILPTGFHGAVTAKVGVGSTVYIAGAGPVGLAAAAAARILGAAVILIGDMNQERLAHAKKVASSRSISPSTIGWANSSSMCSARQKSIARSTASASRQRRKEQTAKPSKRLLSC